MNWDRVTHIFTGDMPCYFAVVSRVHQQREPIGPRGGVVTSDVIPTITVTVPHGAELSPAPLTMEVGHSARRSST